MAGTRRRRRMIAARAAGVAVLAVAVLAVAFWVPQRRDTTPQPAHPAPCRAEDLRLAPGPPVSPATGEVAASYAVVNTSSSPCTLFGIPRVRLLAADGTRLPFHYTRAPTVYLTAQHPKQVIVAQGGSTASLLVAKYRCDGGDRTHAARIQVTVEGSVMTAPVGNTEIAYCRGGRSDPGQVVAVSAFTMAPAGQ